MKLPSAVKTGVQPLAKKNVGAILRTGAAQAAALQQVSGNLAQIDAQIKQDRNAEQERQARLSMSQAMTDFERQYGGRDSYSADEIPESIQVRRTDKVVNADGVEEEVLREKIPAYEVYPEMYRDFATKTFGAIAETIDDEDLRSQWATNAEIGVNNQYAARIMQARDSQKAFNESQLTSQINDAVLNGEYAAASILADDISDPNRKQQVKTSIKRKEVTDYYNGLLLVEAGDEDDLAEIEQGIEDLRNPDIDMPLTNAERTAMATQMERVAAENEMSQIARDQRENAQIVSDANLAIDSGDPRVTEGTVQTLFDDGLISGQQMTQMKSAIKANHAKKLQEISYQVQLDQVAAAPYGIDPNDKDMRKAVDKRYEAQVAAGGDRKTVAIQTMRDFKVVPSETQSVFRANNRADARGLGDAAEMWLYAEDYAPQSLNDFDQNDVDVIRSVAANMRLGMNKADAVEQVRRFEMMTPEQKSVLKKNAQAMADSNASYLEDRISDYDGYDIPWNPRDPDIPAFMQSEFDAKTERYLPQAGYNTAAAQNMAFADITANWRLTDVNGNYIMMKNPPVGDTDMVRSEITRQYKAEIAQLNEQFPDMRIMAKNIRIASDQLTELQIQRGETPSYMAYLITDEETMETQILKRFTWDSKSANKRHSDAITEKALKEKRERDAKHKYAKQSRSGISDKDKAELERELGVRF